MAAGFEGIEREALGPARARAPGRAHVEEERQADDEHPDRALAPVERGVLERVEHHVVGPLRVVDDQRDRSRLRAAAQPLDERLQHAVVLPAGQAGGRVQDRVREPRRQAITITRARRGGGEAHDERAGVRAAGERGGLGGEAGLAEAGVADERHERGVPARERGREARGERVDDRLPADERRLGREVERRPRGVRVGPGQLRRVVAVGLHARELRREHDAGPWFSGEPGLRPIHRGAEHDRGAAIPAPQRHVGEVERRARAVAVHDLARGRDRGAQRRVRVRAGEDRDVARAPLSRDEPAPRRDHRRHRSGLSAGLDEEHDHGLAPLGDEPRRGRGGRALRRGGPLASLGERSAQRRGAHRAALGDLREAREDEVVQRRGHGRDLARAARLEQQVPVLDGGGRARERRLPREHLEEDHPERVEIGPRVERALAAELLGRHVLRRPHGDPGLRELLLDVAIGALDQAEVEEHDAIVGPGEEDVRGLEIAVPEAFVVRGRDGGEQAVPRARHPGERRRARPRLEARRQRLAGEPLHDEPRAPILELTACVQGGDERRADMPHRVRFSAKPLHDRGALAVPDS
ncbi:MAG: hypothetical protein QM820_45285 [Minicystis sp.]